LALAEKRDYAMYNIAHTEFDSINEILLGLTNISQDAAILDRVRIKLGEGIDWSRLLNEANEHRVLPLLYHNLHQNYRDHTPNDIYQTLHAQVNFIAVQNALFAAELVELVEYLDEHDVCSIPFKGSIAAIVDYESLALRQFGDLDLLVNPDDYERTRELLTARSYRFVVDWGWECTYSNDDLGVHVDLHRALTQDTFPVHLDFTNLCNRLRTINIVGKEVSVLGTEDTLIMLCIQLSKDANAGTNALRLSKVCDINALLRKNQAIDWNWVYGEAGRLGCRRMISLGLNVACELYGAPMPEPILRRARTDGQSGVLTEHICCQLFTPQVSEKPVSASNKFYFRVRERWRDKLFPDYLEFKRRFVPNEKDRALLTLPDSLGRLYYVIRPVRLMIDSTRRLFKMQKPN
jgi:hypothetical protein